jgi:hypothetical protein
MQAMLTVKKYTRGPGGIPVGKPAIHPATVDLRGKAYESVFISLFFFSFIFCFCCVAAVCWSGTYCSKIQTSILSSRYYIKMVGLSLKPESELSPASPTKKKIEP